MKPKNTITMQKTLKLFVKQMKAKTVIRAMIKITKVV